MTNSIFLTLFLFLNHQLYNLEVDFSYFTINKYMFDSSVTPSQNTHKPPQTFHHSSAYRQNDLKLSLSSICDNPEISILNKSQSSASFSLSSGPLSDRNSLQEESFNESLISTKKKGTCENEGGGSMIKKNESKIMVIKSPTRNTRLYT